MNLILLHPEEIKNGTAEITGKKFEHVLSFIKPSPGDTLRTGIMNGLTGEGIITSLDDTKMSITLSVHTPPPAPLPLKLVLAMPRPKVLNRIIQHATSMGIKEIFIIKTWRVEKSYWESPVLEEDNLRRQVIAGLEQARDTVLPAISIRKRFRPFVEDELPLISAGTLPLAAHPVAKNSCPCGIKGTVTLAIGPEGGFIPYEIDALASIGFKPVSLGERILRVETALPFIAGKLF